MKTYAAYYNNVRRVDSSSGGIFPIMALMFDVVYGVAMTKDYSEAEYRRIDDGNIVSLIGSKYLQAKVGDSFILVKEDLLSGRNVLFVGTCCLINGLKCFLRKDYANLTTIDIICHGVPSPLYWNKYIDGKDISFVNFRSKEGGWTNGAYGMKLNEEYIPFDKNKYMSLYLKDYALRPACYECVCKKNKQSDITLGDFWGIEKLYPEMDDNKGTSLVIVRTSKGENVFSIIKAKLIHKEVSYADGIKYNKSEYWSPNKPKKRSHFFKDMSKLSFDELYKKYTYVTPWIIVAKKMKRNIKKLLGKKN